jgi:hypothetical protein
MNAAFVFAFEQAVATERGRGRAQSRARRESGCRVVLDRSMTPRTLGSLTSGMGRKPSRAILRARQARATEVPEAEVRAILAPAAGEAAEEVVLLAAEVPGRRPQRLRRSEAAPAPDRLRRSATGTALFRWGVLTMCAFECG